MTAQLEYRQVSNGTDEYHRGETQVFLLTGDDNTDVTFILEQQFV